MNLFLNLYVLLTISYPFGPKIGFSHLDIENGLSHNTILSLVQDNDGFIWAGSRYGLNRFDGNDFDVFTSITGDSTSLSNDYINQLSIDTHQRLWIGTENGLDLYDRDSGNFHVYFPPGYKKRDQQFGVRTILEDKYGKLWIGTFDGLFYFDPVKLEFLNINNTSETSYRIGHDNIRCLAWDHSGKLLVGTTKGLKILIGNALITFKWPRDFVQKYQNLFVRVIYADSTGDLWFGTEEEQVGLIRFNPDINRIEVYNHSISNGNSIIDNVIRCIKKLDDGNLYIGTRHGLSILNIKEKKFQNYIQNKFDPKSLSSASIRDILQDNDGSLWLATYSGGINYYHKTRYLFQLITQDLGSSNTLNDQSISSVYVPDSSELWIGTENSGLNIYNRETNHFEYLKQDNSGHNLVDNNIKAMVKGPEGNIWVGTYNGLSKIDPKTLKCTNFGYEAGNKNSLSYNQVHTLAFDKENRLWLGTNGGGINILDIHNLQFHHLKHSAKDPNSLINDNLNSMMFDNQGRLWVGTQNGLDCYNPNNEKFGDVNDFPAFRRDLLKTSVVCVFVDSQDQILAGTYGRGLFLLSTKADKIINISKENGIASNIVYGILEDNTGSIWLSTNQGLSKLKINTVSGDSAEFEILNFDENEGLQGRQFLPNSCYYSDNGIMYFGGTKGLNYFKPEEVETFTKHPNVVIKDLIIANKKLEIYKSAISVGHKKMQQPLVINYKQSDFTINFAGINYINPDRTYYAYLLEGGMENWQYIEKQRSVTFSKLPAGLYTFKVKATNNPNNWGDRYTLLELKVLPPPWKTTWAYFIYFVVAGGMLYLFFVITIRWERVNQKFKFEHLEREKEQALHEQRLSFFTDISHELRTPLTLIISPLENLIKQNSLEVKIKNKLMMIQRNGERMLQLINQLLDWRKLERGHMTLKAAKGNIVRFINEVTLSFREMALVRNIQFSFNSELEDIPAFYDRDKLEVVFFNILSNAFKFTPDKGSINIAIRKVENHPEGKENPAFKNGFVEIRIRDSGRGISDKNLKMIFDRFYEDNSKRINWGSGTGLGLELAKKFVDLHKGVIKVKSQELTVDQPGFTEFIILLPLGSNHLMENQIVSNFKNSEDVSLYEQPKIESGVEESLSSVIGNSENYFDKNDRFLLLIVEDNVEVRNFIKNLFERNFEIIEASNGKEGLEKALDLLPDLIISDIMMPEMDGLEMCRILKNDVHTSHVPIILLTARTAITFKFEGFETGADDYITKPFSAELLRSECIQSTSATSKDRGPLSNRIFP